MSALFAKTAWMALVASSLLLVSSFAPISPASLQTSVDPWRLALALLMMALALVGKHLGAALALTALSLFANLQLVVSLYQHSAGAASGFWLGFYANFAVSLAAIGYISLRDSATQSPVHKAIARLLPSASVPLLLLLLWQGLVLGNQVPRGIFPGVHHVWRALNASFGVLLNDSYVTFVQEVLLGLAIGVSSGFLAGVAVAGSRFLQRGFLPLAAAFGAVPIVGLAPVLGRAFGVDWHSKAAVVVIVTFFPVLLNTVQGLLLVDPLRLELLQSYAAKPRHIFLKLRLPNALPYLFNALKLAVVLSVISVIVAEFLIPGPPRGLGQRISLSARQGAYDVVFAAIFVSSVISVTAYGFVSWLERRLTAWHASFRESS